MNKTGLIIAGLVLLSAAPAQAELVKDGIWKVGPGETLQGVLQQTFPNQSLRQARLARLAQRLSPSAFDQDGELVAGQTLRLPGARLTKNVPVAEKHPALGQQIGRVVVTTGSSTATGSDGQSRELQRGAPVYKGDTLTTEKARAQVRFSDGSLLALRPETQFKVDEYNFTGQQDGQERGFFSLIKGGFRTISGAIGKLHKQNYRVKTAVATIGIRGTHYGLTICNPCEDGAGGSESGLFGGVVDGEIVVQNGQGEFTFGNDEYFHIESEGGKPRGLIAPPGFVFGDDSDESADEGSRQDQGEQTAENDSEEGSEEEDQGGFADPGAQEQADQGNLAIFDEQNSSFDTARQDQGLRVYLENEAGSGFSPEGDALQGSQAVVASFVGDGTDIASLDESVSGGFTGSQAYISARDGGGYDLTGIDFTDGDDATRFTFAPESGATPQDAGYAGDFGVSWGRWDDAVLRATNPDKEGVVEAPIKTGLHFMVVENAVREVSDLENRLTSLGTNLLPASKMGGGVIGTLPTSFEGTVGALGNGTTMAISLGQGGYEISQLDINASIGNDSYFLSLPIADVVPLDNIVNNPGHRIDLVGGCQGSGQCSNEPALEGIANIQFLLGAAGQDHSVGAATSYSGHAPSDPSIGFSGTVLFTDTGLPINP